MRQMSIAFLALAAAVGGALLTGRQLAAQATGSSNCCAAVVDVVRIFNEYDRQKDLEGEFTAWRQQLEAENQQRRQRVDAAAAAVDAMDPTDPARRQRMVDTLRMQMEYKNWADFSQADVQREFGVWTTNIYAEITRAVEQVAQTRGVQVVLYRDEFTPAADLQALRDQIRGRKVLFYTPQADLTQAVLDQLNNAYRAAPKQRMLQVPAASQLPAVPNTGIPPAPQP